MWHQLVLSGVGGRTIAEAKERLSLAEFRSWVKFIGRRGSLHTGMRVEEGFAMLAALNANLSRDPSKNPTPYRSADFMRHDFERPQTLEGAMATWA
ncbi:phage tail assembly protein T [Pseudomonas syringae]